MGRMRALIASSLEASISVGDRHGWQPEAGSTAACEREDAPAGNGVALAVEVGWNLMGAQALEGIETIAHLLSQPAPPTYSLYPIARMAIETLARAWWLFEPDLGASDRAARGLGEFIAAFRKNLERPDLDARETIDRLGRVQTMAQDFGLAIKLGNDGLISKVGDVHREKTGALLESFYEDADLGIWVHAVMSEASHGNVVALFRGLDDVPDDEGMYRAVREGDLRLIVASVLIAWWQCDVRRVELLGWRDEEWVRAGQAVHAELTAMIQPMAVPLDD